MKGLLFNVPVKDVLDNKNLKCHTNIYLFEFYLSNFTIIADIKE